MKTTTRAQAAIAALCLAACACVGAAQPAPAVDALFAESDRLGHLLGVLDQKKLDLQRGVVQNEKREGENQPYGVARQLLTENTYPPGHPYSWTTIGSMKDLEAAAMDDVREWFKS